MTTRSNRLRRSSSASATLGHRDARRSRYSAAEHLPIGLPITTTWHELSPSAFSRIGFIAASAGTPAASACTACARPISAPSRVTAELSAMFCDLNGATRRPRLA